MSTRRPVDIRRSLATVRKALDMKAAGASYVSIAAEVGVADTTVRKWVNYAKAQPEGWPTLADIAAWEADDRKNGAHRAHRAALQASYAKRRYLLRGERLMISSLGTTRRLRALAAIGWFATELGPMLGFSSTRAGHLMAGSYPEVRRDTAARVAALYDELSMQVPVDPEPTPRHIGRLRERQRRLAAAKGWAPPLAWDDIDDPNEKPTGWQPVSTKGRKRAAEIERRVTVLEEVDQEGGDVDEACRRVGLKRDSLERWCERHSQTEVFSRLVRRANPDWGGCGTRWDGAA